MNEEKTTPDNSTNQSDGGIAPNQSSNIPNVKETTAKPEKEEKKGLWYRIVHSKDSTKLAGALAFCAVFATCTLLAVTVFDKPGHIADQGKNVRMEQKADNNGSAPDMDAQKRPDSNNEGNDRRDFRNHRNFKDNNDSRNDETPGDKKSSSSDEDANSTDENKSDNKSQSDDNADSGKKNRNFKDNRLDSQNAPTETPNDQKSDNSKTANLA